MAIVGIGLNINTLPVQSVGVGIGVDYAVSYETLMNATMQSLVTNNTINTHMRNIRKKFEKVDPGFGCIKSEYGFGYRWSVS